MRSLTGVLCTKGILPAYLLASLLTSLMAGGLVTGCGDDVPSDDWQVGEEFEFSPLDEVARCREHRGTQASYFHANPGFGDWVLALSEEIASYSDLSVQGADRENRIAAATFHTSDDRTAGAVFSRALDAERASPPDVLTTYREALADWAHFDKADETTAFETHDMRQAIIGEYAVRLDEAVKLSQARDQLLVALAPFSAADVAEFPEPSGPEARAFRLKVSVVSGVDDTGRANVLTSMALAPLDAAQSIENRFVFDDLTNTTHLAKSGADHAIYCGVFTARPASRYLLDKTPMTGTLHVELAGTPVPRSREDGWTYYPQTNALALSGSYRTLASQQARQTDSVTLQLSFETFVE